MFDRSLSYALSLAVLMAAICVLSGCTDLYAARATAPVPGTAATYSSSQTAFNGVLVCETSGIDRHCSRRYLQ